MKKSNLLLLVIILGLFLSSSIIASIGSITSQEFNQKSSVATSLPEPVINGMLPLDLSPIINQIESKNDEIDLKAVKSNESINRVSNMIILAFIVLEVMIVFFAAIFIIKRIKREKKELIEAKEHAEKLAKVREGFLSDMSHEIRTPMNVIIGFTEQLLKPGSKENSQMLLLGIKRSTEYLLRLINDLLDYSKIESGKLNTESIGFKWKEVVQDVYFLLKEKAEAKNLDFKYQIEGPIPDIVLGDPVRLKQVLLNLVDNAIKFTFKGRIAIICQAEKLSDGFLKLKITVKDTGIGINEKKVDKVFEVFTQENIGITRKFGGSGLGLSICKRLLELQGGSIEVKSIEGKGSEFISYIPYKIGIKEETNEEELEKETDFSALIGIKVLIVDDEEFNRQLSKIILQGNKVLVHEATGGREAMDLIKVNNYDVVLMDIQMPDMNGLDAVKELREIEGQIDLPVIALTANARKEDEQFYLSAGMNDYLSKPFKEKELLNKIISVLKDKLKKEVIDYPQLVEDEDNQEELYDLNELKKITRDDEAFFKKIIELFIENTPESAEKIKTAGDQHKWEQVSMLAHKMRPSFAHMGIKDMAEILKVIEENAEEKKHLDKLPDMINTFYKKTERIINKLEKLINYHPH